MTKIVDESKIFNRETLKDVFLIARMTRQLEKGNRRIRDLAGAEGSWILSGDFLKGTQAEMSKVVKKFQEDEKNRGELLSVHSASSLLERGYKVVAKNKVEAGWYFRTEFRDDFGCKKNYYDALESAVNFESIEAQKTKNKIEALQDRLKQAMEEARKMGIQI